MAKAFVFVDSRVLDWQSLLAGAVLDTEMVVLNAENDGVEQIRLALQGVTDLASIQVISHGSSGTLYLGSTVLTEENLNSYQTDLSQIGATLSADGDILLYGCNVAAGETGSQFIQTLTQLTGADVAASTDPTGGAAAGGDWMLEASVGTIEAVTPFEASAQADYSYTLAAAGTLDPTFGGDGIVITRLFFDDPVISAAEVSIAFNFSGDDFRRWSFSYGGKNVKLILASDLLPTSVVAFASGDGLVVGDNTVVAESGDTGPVIYEEPGTTATEILFVDSRVQDYQSLTQGLSRTTAASRAHARRRRKGSGWSRSARPGREVAPVV